MLPKITTMRSLDKAQMLQFGKYFIAGGCAALIEWMVFWLFSSWLQVFYLFSVAIAFIVATTVNYFLSAFFVFVRGKHRRGVETLLVFLVSAVGLGLNSLLMWLLHGKIGILAMPSKIVSTGIVFLWNYYSRHKFIFGSTSAQSDQRPRTRH